MRPSSRATTRTKWPRVHAHACVCVLWMGSAVVRRGRKRSVRPRQDLTLVCQLRHLHPPTTVRALRGRQPHALAEYTHIHANSRTRSSHFTAGRQGVRADGSHTRGGGGGARLERVYNKKYKRQVEERGGEAWGVGWGGAVQEFGGSQEPAVGVGGVGGGAAARQEGRVRVAVGVCVCARVCVWVREQPEEEADHPSHRQTHTHTHADTQVHRRGRDGVNKRVSRRSYRRWTMHGTTPTEKDNEAPTAQYTHTHTQTYTYVQTEPERRGLS